MCFKSCTVNAFRAASALRRWKFFCGLWSVHLSFISTTSSNFKINVCLITCDPFLSFLSFEGNIEFLCDDSSKFVSRSRTDPFCSFLFGVRISPFCPFCLYVVLTVLFFIFLLYILVKLHIPYFYPSNGVFWIKCNLSEFCKS